MGIEKPELNRESKYTLPQENIICLDENSEIRQREKELFLGLKDEGIDWPVEIQGSGRSDFDNKTFKVFYPKGDLFTSLAVTIHELGHLRQGEADQRFLLKALGAPITETSRELEVTRDTEHDAWQRGLMRTKKYCAEFFSQIEKKFKKYKKQGCLTEFENFESFINQVMKACLKVNELNELVEQETQEEGREKGRKLGRRLKSDELTNHFFTKPENWRVGEIVDQEEIEKFIRKMAENIAEENYTIPK
jgi:hypothetical protein